MELVKEKREFRTRSERPPCAIADTVRDRRETKGDARQQREAVCEGAGQGERETGKEVSIVWGQRSNAPRRFCSLLALSPPPSLSLSLALPLTSGGCRSRLRNSSGERGERSPEEHKIIRERGKEKARKKVRRESEFFEVLRKTNFEKTVFFLLSLFHFFPPRLGRQSALHRKTKPRFLSVPLSLFPACRPVEQRRVFSCP